jgi:hypothetical protein
VDDAREVEKMTWPLESWILASDSFAVLGAVPQNNIMGLTTVDVITFTKSRLKLLKHALTPQ